MVVDFIRDYIRTTRKCAKMYDESGEKGLILSEQSSVGCTGLHPLRSLTIFTPGIRRLLGMNDLIASG